MLELLQTYALLDIIIFVPLLALAIKGCISFYDWAHERISKTTDKKYKNKQGFEALKDKIDDIEKADEKICERVNAVEQQCQDLQQQIDLLVKSDVINMRTLFVEKYHYFIQQGWIDDFSMLCLEDLYAIYKDEGGNYFVQDLMEDLRNLPKSKSSSSFLVDDKKEREKES